MVKEKARYIMNGKYIKRTSAALNKTISGLSVGSLITSTAFLPGWNAAMENFKKLTGGH